MNVYHMNCRNLRSLGLMLAVVVGLYILLNVIYISLFQEDVPLSADDPHDRLSEKIDAESIAARLKFAKPNADGKVEVVVSLDVKQLAKLLGNSDLGGLYPQFENEKQVISSRRPPNAVGYSLYNPSLCDDIVPFGVTWLNAIYSTPEQFERRKLLRTTWANAALFRQSVSRTVFVVGQTNDIAAQSSLQLEFAEHRDIVQGNFVDTQRNATLKGLLALHYASHHCTKAKYLIKANDDTFVNIFAVLQLLLASASRQHLVVCPLWKENTMPILRDPKECMQWCVATDELPGRTHFPQYCAGIGFVLSRELVSALYTTALKTPFFWIDDVYITGLLMPEVAQQLHGIHFVDLISNFSLVEENVATEYKDRGQSMHFVIAKIQTAEIHQDVWRTLLKRLTPSQFKLLSDSAIAQYA